MLLSFPWHSGGRSVPFRENRRETVFVCCGAGEQNRDPAARHDIKFICFGFVRTICRITLPEHPFFALREGRFFHRSAKAKGSAPLFGQ